VKFRTAQYNQTNHSAPQTFWLDLREGRGERTREKGKGEGRRERTYF